MQEVEKSTAIRRVRHEDLTLKKRVYIILVVRKLEKIQYQRDKMVLGGKKTCKFERSALIIKVLLS